MTVDNNLGGSQWAQWADKKRHQIFIAIDQQTMVAEHVSLLRSYNAFLNRIVQNNAFAINIFGYLS